MIRNYDDLDVYKKSYEAALEAYTLSKKLPKEEAYGLTSQVRRASLSIPLNIAEGYGKRESIAEFKRYLYMAKGSCDEMKVLADFIKDLGYLDGGEHEVMKTTYDEIGKMLHGLIKHWK